MSFKWKIEPNETGLAESDILVWENKKKYQLTARYYYDSYRVDVLEDKKSVISENTANITFKSIEFSSENLNDKIIEWAILNIKNKIGICDLCKDNKIVLPLTKHDVEQVEFDGLKSLCPICRKSVYNKIYEKEAALRKEEDNKRIRELDKRPPKIIGNFIDKYDAYIELMQINNPDRTDDDGLVFVKAILKANDNSYYPVFMDIAEPGGENWGANFIANNYKEVIPQHLAMKYLNKQDDEIYPYDYETIAHIGEDFHQRTRFGNISNPNVKHHFHNQIKLVRSEKGKSYFDTDKVEVRSYFSISHLLGCNLNLDKLKGIKQSKSNDIVEDSILEYRTLVVSIIMSSVSFLESTINEIFMDAYENKKGVTEDLQDEVIERYAALWRKGIPRTAYYGIIDKYQIALVLANHKEFDLGEEPAQSISSLIKLRNALVHYEPEFVVTKNIDSAKNNQQSLEKRLKGRFELNSFTGVENPFFPDKCLSLGCAKWAMESAIEFTDLFFHKLRIIPTYQKVRYKLKI